VLSLHKTVRKYFGEAIVVTQEVEDIISSPIVKESIINNADCKILLDQRKYRNKFDQIQTLLGLTDKERAQVLSINLSNDPARRYKEVFISLGGALRRIGTATYRMLVYDHTLCYRRLVQDAVVTLRRHRLLFGEEEDCGANRVEYDPAVDRLTLGCYGLFLPDDATHPAAEEFETPVE